MSDNLDPSLDELVSTGTAPLGPRTPLAPLAPEQEEETAESMLSTLDALDLAGRFDGAPDLPPSTVEPVLRAFSVRTDLRDEAERPATAPSGDLSTDPDPASRVSLRGTELSEHPVPASSAGGALTNAPRMSLRAGGGAPSPDSSTMGTVDSSGGRMALSEETRVRRAMPDNMSEILAGRLGPRLELPPRSQRSTSHKPDGVTPISPSLEVVHGAPGPEQACSKKGVAPREVTESVRERLDFRYNRFRRLQVRRPVLWCPGCGDGAEFTASQPVFWCHEAPVGDGLLAMLAVSLYFDRLPLDKLMMLLEQLGAPIPAAALLRELARASEALVPLVAKMRTDAETTEGPLPATVTGTARDTPGAIEVRTGGGHVVLSFLPGEVRKSDARRRAGPAALQRWKGQGLRGRWSQIRQRFFLALLTDPERAGRALYEISKLPPDPDSDPAALAGFKAWLDGESGSIGAPRDRYTHAVVSVSALWGKLTETDPPPRAQSSDTWIFDSADGDAHAALRWLTLIESCVAQGVQPWDYLYALLRDAAAGGIGDVANWTPAAYAQRA